MFEPKERKTNTPTLLKVPSSTSGKSSSPRSPLYDYLLASEDQNEVEPSIMRKLSRPSLNLNVRYGSFNDFSHSGMGDYDVDRFVSGTKFLRQKRPWEDDHSNLEDSSVRQLALEFNLGALSATLLTVSINICFDHGYVIAVGLIGLITTTVVYACGKYTLGR
eukprot:UN31589